MGYTLDQCTGGTPISSGAGAGTVAGAFDDDGASSYSIPGGTNYWRNNHYPTTTGDYIGYDFGSGNNKHIRQVRYKGFNVSSIKIEKWNGTSWDTVATVSPTTAYVLDYAPNYNPPWETFALSASAAAQKWRLTANANAPNDGHGDGWWYVMEIEMMELSGDGIFFCNG